MSIRLKLGENRPDRDLIIPENMMKSFSSVIRKTNPNSIRTKCCAILTKYRSGQLRLKRCLVFVTWETEKPVNAHQNGSN